MCIRDRPETLKIKGSFLVRVQSELDYRPIITWTADAKVTTCLLYTSDAADERSSVDLGGRRIIKKKNNV